MSRLLRFLVPLLLGLAALTAAASWLVSRTTWSWSEKDISLRSELAVAGARPSLVSYWRAGARPQIRALLADLAHDERIMGAAACDTEGALLAATAEYPLRVGCLELVAQARGGEGWTSWKAMLSIPGGEVHVSAIPLFDGARPLGLVSLVHDMSFVARRDAKTRRFVIAAFAVLALGASVLTVVAARLSWRGWNRALRDSIRSGGARPEFRLLLRDLRELVEGVAAERDPESQGEWTAARLKQTLARHLEGERVVVLANREPYIHDRGSDGAVTVLHPASGLVTALEPVMRACSGVWVAHGSGSADRATADSAGRLRVPPGAESYVLRRVWLSPDEEKGYYYGFANEGLWPLCHIAHIRPVFRAEDWKHYQVVNQRFADAVCEEAEVDDPIILVQDYHFALAPAYIRERLPRATVLTFWHIPWPNSERFGICPWREELLQGLLGSTILGFHTRFHCNNFLDAVDAFLEARIDRERVAVVQKRRTTLVRPYPISVEHPSRWLREVPTVRECRATVVAELGLAPDALIGVSVDRLDYTKGIEERLLSVERLLERAPALQDRFVFVVLAAPSRTAIDAYRALNERVESLAARINERFGKDGRRPVILRRAHHEPPTVYRYFRAADLCYVSSVHDGMNLVAKEFVSARDDEQGVLVLSQFTGAARELTEALIVNPYDLEETSAALETALRMPAAEQRDRMRAMRSYLAHFNVYRWAGRMLVDAAQARRRDRLTGRLGAWAQDRGAHA
jgi:trehalose 6-phosphate synthase